MLQESECAPQFETKIEGIVEGIPMLGKPDLRFIHPLGVHVILDWKVNGYCSKSPVSPCKNYRLCRDGWSSSKTGQAHKNYRSLQFKGIEIHAGYLEEASTDWSNQLSIYSWILNEPVGTEEVVFCIDQIVAKPSDPHPLLRVANHRSRISSQYQKILMGRIQAMWNSITEGHIFKDMSKEESIARCQVLDQEAIALYTTALNSVKRLERLDGNDT